ncbi:MAG: prohibitin family protein [Chloroflexi bacterium]|nr:prohibitin family protein [Chloroflexota bacterium]
MNIVAVVRSVSALAWFLFFVTLALAFFRLAKGRPARPLVLAAVATFVFAAVLTTVGAGLVFVPPEMRGVVISAVAPKGYREQPLEPGLRWIIPYAEYVKLYPISKQTYTMSSTPAEGDVYGDDSIEARTKDGQLIFMDASVIYSIDPARVVEVHITWQDRYAQDLVRPLARGIIRDAVSQFRVDEVVSTHRFQLRDMIFNEMKKRLAENGLILHDFVLRNITFTEEYARAVEEKQIAEQRAQQAKFLVEQKKYEAEQMRQIAQGEADARIIRAKGEAEARLIQAEAEAQALAKIATVLSTNPELLTYEYIQRLAPGIKVMLVPADNPYLLPLPELSPEAEAGPAPVPNPTPTPAPNP